MPNRPTTSCAALRWASGTLAAAALLGIAACGSVPTAQTIAGAAPSGTVTLNETFVAGYGGGSGTLTFNGRSYPFDILGTVVGPGGAAKIMGNGEVYFLNTVTQFPGRYTQSTGAAGIDKGGPGQLWLQNGNGVVMHLASTTQGALLSLGRDEIFVRMNQ